MLDLTLVGSGGGGGGGTISSLWFYSATTDFNAIADLRVHSYDQR